MKILTSTVARLLFALPFFVFSLGHLMNGSEMATMIPFPGALLLNYLAGLGLLLASIAIIINKKAKLASLLLALELFLFVVLLHIPKMMGIGDVSMFCDSEEMMVQVGMVNTFKDIGLMAAALFFAGTLKD